MRGLLVVLTVMGCAAPRQGTPGARDRSRTEGPGAKEVFPWGDSPALEDLGPWPEPGVVTAALHHRRDAPQRALSMLVEAHRSAAASGDRLVETWSLLRAADVMVDLAGTEAAGQAVQALLGTQDGQLPGREGARAVYARAYRQAEAAGDRRLAGRVAHDLAWSLECSGGGRDGEGAEAWYRRALEHRVAARDGAGVRVTANNLGRLITSPKRLRLAYYRLALHAAAVMEDQAGQRKVHTNIARLWFFSADTSWADPGASAPVIEYAHGPLTGEVRRRFLEHLELALAAARRAGEPSQVVCEGLNVEGPPCHTWGEQSAEALFPEGCCGPRPVPEPLVPPAGADGIDADAR